MLPGWAAAAGRGWGGKRGPVRAAVTPLEPAGAASVGAGAAVGPRGSGAAALMWQRGGGAGDGALRCRSCLM